MARAQPDGYTLMVGTDAMMTTNVYLYKNAPFDPVKDFAPVIYAGANIICLAVNTEFPANSVADVIAYARANPGKLHLRLVRGRLAASSCGRAPASEDRHRHRPCPLSRRRGHDQ